MVGEESSGGGRFGDALRYESRLQGFRSLEVAVDGRDILWPPDVAEALDGLIDEVQGIFGPVSFASTCVLGTR